MRKKNLFVLIILSFMAMTSIAQNIQFHYDFGRKLYKHELGDRPLWTSTVEDFITDKWGSTYFFIDMRYAKSGVESSYWEISRELKFWKNPFSLHVEYNGGDIKNIDDKYNIRNAYLTGITYTWNKPDYTCGFSFSAMYKYIQNVNSSHNFQFTTTWYLNLADKLVTLDGFADFWREENDYGKTIFLTQPQVWVNLNKIKGVDKDFNLSIGSEVELSNNFGGRDGFYVIPTAAIKWTFK